MKQIQIVTDIDQEQLIQDIVLSLNHEEIVEFIGKLELAYEDWEVTWELTKYFVNQMKEFDDEEYDINSPLK